MNLHRFRRLLCAALTALILSGCGKSSAPGNDAASGQTPAHHHEHVAPHGGTPVVLGEESFHIEFVLDAPSARMSAYVLDGELENFVRITQPGFAVAVKREGVEEVLLFKPIANQATGETVGDTSLFEATAPWLSTVKTFEGVIQSVTLRGSTFSNVAFNFPGGNDKK